MGRSILGNLRRNAVVDHQKDQAGLPTSGISTTPHLDRAKFYATHGCTRPRGYIYVMDTSTFDAYRIKKYVVKEIVAVPNVPEDDEVTLVAHDFGILPKELIIDMHEVTS